MAKIRSIGILFVPVAVGPLYRPVANRMGKA